MQLTKDFFRSALRYFQGYADSYLQNRENESCRYQLDYKKKHSFRVSAINGVVAGRIGLDEDDILLARLAGLFHDIARFDQYSKFKTFRDSDSFDHGDYGAELLATLDFLTPLDPAVRKRLETAVRYHNKREIAAGVSGDDLLHCRLLRDADKLDILFVTLRGMRNGSSRLLSIADSDQMRISPDVISALAEKKPVDYRKVRTESDFMLVKIGWVYDINFVPSLAILEKRNCFQTLRNLLPETEILKERFSQMDTYIHEALVRPVSSWQTALTGVV